MKLNKLFDVILASRDKTGSLPDKILMSTLEYFDLRNNGYVPSEGPSNPESTKPMTILNIPIFME